MRFKLELQTITVHMFDILNIMHGVKQMTNFKTRSLVYYAYQLLSVYLYYIRYTRWYLNLQLQLLIIRSLVKH